jgi:hypothetical protein
MRTRSPVLTAFLNPLNLLILPLAAVAGLCSAWWLFPVGLLFWLVMFIIVANDPTLKMAQTMDQRTALAQRFQARFDRIERIQVSIFNTLSSANPSVRRVLQPIQDAADQITDQAYRLCLRMSALENHRLVMQSTRDMEGELAQIDQKLAEAADPLVKREYEESRQALEKRLGNLRHVATQLDRVEAQLSSLASTLDGALTEAVRLQSLGSALGAAQVSAVVQTIQAQADEIKAFEKEIAQ